KRAPAPRREGRAEKGESRNLLRCGKGWLPMGREGLQRVRGLATEYPLRQERGRDRGQQDSVAIMAGRREKSRADRSQERQTVGSSRTQTRPGTREVGALQRRVQGERGSGELHHGLGGNSLLKPRPLEGASRQHRAIPAEDQVGPRGDQTLAARPA